MIATRLLLTALVLFSASFLKADLSVAPESDMNQTELTGLFNRIYRDLYGFEMTSPAIYENSGSPIGHRWTSTAYVGEKLYRIYLDEDGSYRSWYEERVLGRGYYIFPKQTLKVFVMISDDGSTNIADLHQTLWPAMQQQINDLHAQHALSIGLPEPILQFENTNLLVDADELQIDYTSYDPYWAWDLRDWMVERGHDPAEYDLVALLILTYDSPQTHAAGSYRHPDFPFIYSNNIYRPAEGEVVDLSRVEANGLPALYRITDILYNHEGSHLFGWEHEWAPGYDTSHAHPRFQAAPQLFGWTDTDDDGVPEILDPTPYGIQEAPAESTEARPDDQTGILGQHNPTPSIAPFNGWLVLDGLDDSAVSEARPAFDLNGPLTIETWVDLQSFSDAQIMRKGGAYSFYTEARTQSQENIRCLNVQIWSYRGSFRLQRCMPDKEEGLWLGGWHHVAGVYDRNAGVAGQMSLFIDGQRLGDPWDVWPIGYAGFWVDETSEALEVGSSLTGTVDELRLSDSVRYNGDSYAVPAAPWDCDEHTRALWRFDELEGSTIFRDACGAADIVLEGRNGAHTAGVPGSYRFLPLILQ